MAEDNARTAEDIAAGIELAQAAIAGGEACIAAYLLEEPEEDVRRVTGATVITG
jgi:hypothetical protein